MHTLVTQIAGQHLTRASAAERLCELVFANWESEVVVLDFSDVRTFSPSFANTFLLNLLHRLPADELRERVQFVGLSAHIQQAIERAIDRHEKLGMELTAYLPA